MVCFLMVCTADIIPVCDHAAAFVLLQCLPMRLSRAYEDFLSAKIDIENYP